MPSIIAAPVRTRNDNRGMTEQECIEYITLMDQVEKGQIVLVDDSAADNYEKAYARGERVRQAIKKHAGEEYVPVKVIAFEATEGEFVAGVCWK